MDQPEAASIPLPVSTAATPFSSPLSRPQRWFQGALHASPNSSPVPDRLSMIEIVPPTPPRPRRQVPMTPIEDDEVSLPPGSPSMSVTGTPGGRRSRMMNRMSGAFHAGTPPPATRMLHPDDAKPRHGAISNTFLRDGKRSSIVSNLPSSRRQSVVSAHRDAPWEQGADGQLEEEEEMDYNEQYHSARRPRIHHRETTSDETYVSQPTASDSTNWRESDSTNITLSKALRADPLAVLERRRRRDYTLGSHHPLRGPPNTPLQENRRLSRVSDVSEEEVPNVEWGDILNRFRTVWRRFGDMPWVADPCVATLVIPQSEKPAGEKSDSPVVPWYRPRPTLDEMLAGEAEVGQVEGEGDNDSTTLAHYGPVSNGQSPKQSKWLPRMPQTSHQPGRERFGNALVVRGIVRR